MFGQTPATRIYVACGATDLRKGFNGLYALACGVAGANPMGGHLFLFCNRRRDAMKALFWDGSGLWVCAKRLEKGTFAWPRPGGDGVVEMSQCQLALLLGGMDLGRTRERRWWRSD